MKVIRITSLLILAASFVARAQTPSATPAEQLGEVQQCLMQLRSTPQDDITSPCAWRVEVPKGLSRQQIDSALGKPTFCQGATQIESCKPASKWGYSFYRLPKDMLGGGPELIITFDERDRVSDSKWMGTQ